MLQHPGNRISLESYDEEVGFVLSCIYMKQSTWKDLYQLKEHQGACQIAFLTILSLAVQLLPESHSHYSGRSQASLHSAGYVCSRDLRRRTAEVLNDP